MTEMTNKSINKGKKLLKLLRAPIKILIRARDFYIKSLTDCSGSNIGYGSLMGCPMGQISALPRNFSVNSTHSYASSIDEDFRELIRVASARSSLSIKISEPSDLFNLRRDRRLQHNLGQSPSKLPRSFSTGIGSIDEEKPCEFEPNVEVKPNLYPRSKSYAVNRRNGFL